MNLQKAKLQQIITEMQDSRNYYSQPQRHEKNIVVCVAPGKQPEWISRLIMIEKNMYEEDYSDESR